VLIDEARVPLVIAGASRGDDVDIGSVDALALSLSRGVDYDVDPEGRKVMLRPAGESKLEEFAGRDAPDAD